jgi:hypothetical protein
MLLFLFTWVYGVPCPVVQYLLYHCTRSVGMQSNRCSFCQYLFLLAVVYLHLRTTWKILHYWLSRVKNKFRFVFVQYTDISLVEIQIKKKTFFNTALSATPQISLCRRMPGLWRLWQRHLGRHSNQSAIDLIKHSARSHPHPAKSHPHSAPDCIYTQLQISSAIRLGLIHNFARSHPQFGKILSTIRQDLIHNLARSHQQFAKISSTID